MRAPSLAQVNLGVFSVFMLVAGVGSVVPQIVRDRLPDQIRPLLQRVLGTPDEEWGLVGERLAIVSQWTIGATEFAAGFLGLGALLLAEKRVQLAQLGLGLATGLFGTFMIVLFFLHEAELPKWAQYPPMLVWIAVTWLLLQHEATGQE